MATDDSVTTAPWFRRVTFYSTLSALAPLIPVPYLDDRVLASIRRRMVAGMLSTRDTATDPETVRVLAEGVGAHIGCVHRAFGLLLALTVKLIGRLIRKVLIFLTFKQAADEASKSFHLGYLLNHALETGLLSEGVSISPERAAAFHDAVRGVLATVDHRPIEQLFKRSFRGSWRLLRRSARTLVRGGADQAASDESVREQEEQLGGQVDSLSAALEAQSGYFRRLEAEMDSEMNRRTQDFDVTARQT